ncbi:5939_t:CDS:2, partial [Acaulospora morrowiae]
EKEENPRSIPPSPIIIDRILEPEDLNYDHYALHSNPPYFCISGTTAYHYKNSQATQPFDSIEEETRVCMLALQERLYELGLDWSDVTNMNVYIKDMNEFSKMNGIYKTFFDINPPTRACVASNLFSPIKIQIDLSATKLPSDANKINSTKPMKTMHVQSMSYWAPANIGPYSQAKIINNHAYIAGQIGLIPSSLEFPIPQDISSQTALSLRNLEKIANALELNVKKRSALCICYVDDKDSFGFVRKSWNWFCGNSEDPKKPKSIPPVLYVSVPSLPKRGKVEWQVLVHDESNFEEIDHDDHKSSEILKNYLVSGEPLIFNDELNADDANPLMIKVNTWSLSPITSSVITIKFEE